MTEPIQQDALATKPADTWLSRAASVQTGGNLNPATLEGVTQLAQMLQKSPLLPKALQGDIGGTILVLAQTVQMGLPWTVGLRELYVVGNKVSVQARLLRALVERDPNCLQFYVKEATNEKCVTVIQRRGMEKPIEVVYTLQDATKAGLTQKNPNYQSRPREMLIARSTSLAANTYFPSVCLGLDLDEPEVAYAVNEAPEPPPLRRRRQPKPDPLADFEPEPVKEIVVEAEELPVTLDDIYPREEEDEDINEDPRPLEVIAQKPAPKAKPKAKVPVEDGERPGASIVEVRPPVAPLAQVDEDDAMWVVDYAKNNLGEAEAKTALRRLLADAGVSNYASVKEGVMQLTTDGYTRVLMALRAQVKEKETLEDQPTRGRRV